MIVSLQVKNVALISEAEINFCNGLNILSGETGAGKSVLLDSINFVLGAKADKTMIRYGEQYCLVTCVFNNLPNEVYDILSEYDIERSDEIIIKRKFDINGNGYIKLNGENVTATMLRKITSLLVDVHGQSEHFSLLNKSNQLECIDAGGNTFAILNELAQTVARLKQTEKQIDEIGGDPEARAARIDILNYQINEIENANLKEGEKEELQALKLKLNNLEKLSSALGGAYGALSNEGVVIDGLVFAEQSLKSVTEISDSYAQLFERIQAIRAEVSDISDAISDLSDDLSAGDFLNVDEIEQRLEIYHNFARKYGATISDINLYLQKVITERDNLLNFDQTTKQLFDARQKYRNEAYELCKNLSAARRKYAKCFSNAVTQKLEELGIQKAQFIIQFDDLPELCNVKTFNKTGLDKIEFLFSANAGEPVKSLSKIISGGEMSRFMLALKTQTIGGCATYIFDEIDAGISGITAGIVAKHFAQISKNRQIIAISHLPQIAAMSDLSLLIKKDECEGKTYTQVHQLTEQSKLNEIVRLIGGSECDETAIQHAEKMIENANAYKKSI